MSGLFEKSGNKPSFLKKISHEVFVKDYSFFLNTRQEFVNKSDDNVELVYKFKKSYSPHAITCELYDPVLNSREILEGKIKDSEIAKEKYDDTISSGNRSVLVEEDEAEEVYSLSLGNIKPKMEIAIITKTTKEIELEMEEDERDTMNFHVTIPSLVSKDGSTEKTVTARVEISLTAGKIEEFSSPSHPFGFEEVKMEERFAVVATKEGIESSLDCTVSFQVKNFPISTCLVSPLSETQKYKDYKFASMVQIIPNFYTEIEKTKTDLIVIVDCSGSMSGSRMRTTKEALALLLQSLDLTRKLKFNIIKFGSTFKKLFSESKILNETGNVEAARKYIRLLGADLGGTNIHLPVQYAMGVESDKIDPEKREKLLKKCIENEICTFKATKKLYTTQRWYNCETCGLVGNTGCCESCRKVCHRGHKINEAARSPSTFFCDCGEQGKVCKLGEKLLAEEKVEEKKEKQDDGFTKQIFLFTDGEDENETKTLEMVRQNFVEKNVRIFSFGIGSGINRSFCEKIAEISKGESTFIENNKDMKAKILRQLKFAFKNTINDCKVKFDDETSVLKCRKGKIPMIFNGNSHTEFYFFKKIPKEITLSYSYQEKLESHSIKPVELEEDDSVKVLAAREMVKQLKEDKKGDEIKEIGLNFSIITSKTSFFLKSKSDEKVVSDLKTIDVNVRDEKPNLSSSSSSTRRAMTKSYSQSGGTVLSTNWNSVPSSKPKTKPPPFMQQFSSFQSHQPMSSTSSVQIEDMMKQDFNEVNMLMNDMDTLVKSQEETIDDIESNVENAYENVRKGTKSIEKAKPKKKGIFGKLKDLFFLGEGESDKKKEIVSEEPSMKFSSPFAAPEKPVGSNTEKIDDFFGEVSGGEPCDEPEEEEEEEQKVFMPVVKEKEKNTSKRGKKEVKINPLRAAVSNSNLSHLLMCCDMAGIWKMEKKVLSYVGVSMVELKKNQPSTVSNADLWITAVIIAILQTVYSQKKIEWELIAKKSKRSLKKEKGLLKEAQKFVNSLLNK